MYLMGRERRVSFVLSSHARFLSGAHEGQWVQYYIYCQNDPVSLIDPTGYSPENTGTPIRFTPKNYSNIQSSEGGMNSCYMEDYTLMVAAVQNPDGSNINMAEAGRQAAWRDAEHRRNEHQDLLIEGMFGSNDGCNAYWTEIWIDVYGVRIEYNKDGSIRDVFPLDDNSPKNRQIAYGIRDALNELKDQGVKFSLKEIQVLLHDVEEFGNKYLTGLEKRFGKAFETRTLVKHIVMAGAIKQHINVEPDAQPNGDFTRYDMEIAFWQVF
ncbi:MAG TPA: hypothetical protein PK581_04555 [Caldisericia bacterium]|nr:hypothetical protein [Caldisericia bacterium]